MTFLFFEFFFENQNFGRKPYFSIWFLMIFSSGFSILYPGHEFCILITCWPRDLLHFVWVCAAHNILMQFIYRDTWHISKFFLEAKSFDLQSDPSDMQPVMILSLSFLVSLPPTLFATLGDIIRMCCLSPESYCSSEKNFRTNFLPIVTI